MGLLGGKNPVWECSRNPCAPWKWNFGEVSPEEGCHLLTLIILFSSFNGLSNLKECLANETGKNIPKSIVRQV